MNAKQYLHEVANTVAALGHRDIGNFMSATSIANQATRGCFSNEVLLHEARLAANQLRLGLNRYMPGAKWFDATTAIEYATLVAKFNTVTAE